MKESKNIPGHTICLLLILGGVLIFPFLQFISIHTNIRNHQLLTREELSEQNAKDTIYLNRHIYSTLVDKNEITIMGKKYDVYSVINSTDSTIILLAKHDTYEEYLISEVIRLFEKDHSHQSKAKVFTQPDWICNEFILKNIPAANFTRNNFIFLNNYYSSNHPIIPVPPGA